MTECTCKICNHKNSDECQMLECKCCLMHVLRDPVVERALEKSKKKDEIAREICQRMDINELLLKETREEQAKPPGYTTMSTKENDLESENRILEILLKILGLIDVSPK